MLTHPTELKLRGFRTLNKILTYAAEEDSSCLNKDVWLIDIYDDRIDIVPATKGTISIPLDEE